VGGKSPEKSFATLKLAQDFQLKLTAQKREQGRTFIDPEQADQNFGDHAQGDILNGTRSQSGAETRARDLSLYRTHVAPVFGSRTLAYMATEQAADELAHLLNVTMAHLSKGRRTRARRIVVWAMDAAVKAGRVGSHRMIGIALTDGTAVTRRQQRAMDADEDESPDGFVFVDDATVARLAGGLTVTRRTRTGKPRRHTLTGVGMAAWLQRTMGLRISEALGVERSDFRARNGSVYLRLREQASEPGTRRVPLKHRKAGEGRDVPVPPAVWAVVKDMPGGPLCPGVTTRYLAYNTAWNRFAAITRELGIDGFTTHSLRHQYASETLESIGLENIAVLAANLGHKSVETTLRTYTTANATEKLTDAITARWAGTCQTGWNTTRRKRWLPCPPVTRWSVVAG
jgi:integrase